MSEPLLLIDAYSQIFRCYFGVRPLNNSKGDPTNALPPFARMLLKLRAEFPEARGALVFDCGKVRFREELNPAYKANRPPAPPDLKAQVPVIRELAAAFGWTLLEEPEYEADDLIAALALDYPGPVRILTGDKDLSQLVDDRISILTPDPKAGWEVRDRAATVAKFGVRPDQLVDYLSLLGDSADNIAGVPGIGPKTAAELLSRHGSLEAMLAAPEAIVNERHRRLLLENRDLLARNQKLIALRTALPARLESAAAACARLEPAWEKVRAVCERMELRSILKALPQEEAKREPEAVQGDLFAGL